MLLLSQYQRYGKYDGLPSFQRFAGEAWPCPWVNTGQAGTLMAGAGM